jgi:hypothetical protein
LNDALWIAGEDQPLIVGLPTDILVWAIAAKSANDTTNRAHRTKKRNRALSEHAFGSHKMDVVFPQ